MESEQTVASACDLEMTNVGIHAGTCVIVERYLRKSLLRLMCRHHILELVIKNVCEHLFGAETPRNKFSLILQPLWSELREADFPFNPFYDNLFTENMDLRSYRQYETLMNNVLHDLRQLSLSKKPRDDYNEVTLLALKFFGEGQETIKTHQVKFRTLINPSHAGFMASIILEFYLFRRSIEWTEREEMKHNVMRFTIFAALIFI